MQLTRRHVLGALSVPVVTGFAPPTIASGRMSPSDVRSLFAGATGSNQAIAQDDALWFEVSKAFTVDRSLVNLNNGGVSPSPLWVQQAMKRRDLSETRLNFGEMENELRTARMAVESMIQIASEASPNPETTNEIAIRRTIAGRATIRTVEKAMEVASGAAFFRSLGLERLFRDVQAARYHPLTEKKQLEYTARYTLGLDID